MECPSHLSHNTHSYAICSPTWLCLKQWRRHVMSNYLQKPYIGVNIWANWYTKVRARDEKVWHCLQRMTRWQMPHVVVVVLEILPLWCKNLVSSQSHLVWQHSSTSSSECPWHQIMLDLVFFDDVFASFLSDLFMWCNPIHICPITSTLGGLFSSICSLGHNWCLGFIAISKRLMPLSLSLWLVLLEILVSLVFVLNLMWAWWGFPPCYCRG